MNNINFNQSLGFPLETDTLHEMQKCWQIFNAYGSVVADKAIISGCVISGSNTTDGFVYVNNELLLFKGGATQANVVIVEIPTTADFEDGSSNETYFERYVTFGTSVNQIAWSEFKKPKTLVALTEEKAEQTLIDGLITRILALEARPQANVPLGMIAIWDRPANEIPVGWQEFAGLKGRMPIGLDSAYDNNTNGDNTNYNLQTLNYVGGKREHGLNALENGEHDHDEVKTSAYVGGYIGFAGGGNTMNTFIGKSGKSGTGKAHNNMSPYRVVHFIKYIGN